MMDRRSRNWRIRQELALAIRLFGDVHEAFNIVAKRFGVHMTARVHRRYIKPQLKRLRKDPDWFLKVI